MQHNKTSLRAQHPVERTCSIAQAPHAQQRSRSNKQTAAAAPQPGLPTCCSRRPACSARQLLVLVSACDNSNKSAHQVRSMRHTQRARQAGNHVCPLRSALGIQPHLLRSKALCRSAAAAPMASKQVPLLTWRCCPHLCPHCHQCSWHLLPPPHACHMLTRPAQQGTRNRADVTTHSRHTAGQSARKVIAGGRATSPRCTAAGRSSRLTSPTPHNLTQLPLHSCCSPALPEELQSTCKDALLTSQRRRHQQGSSPTCTAQHEAAQRSSCSIRPLHTCRSTCPLLTPPQTLAAAPKHTHMHSHTHPQANC